MAHIPRKPREYPVLATLTASFAPYHCEALIRLCGPARLARYQRRYSRSCVGQYRSAAGALLSFCFLLFLFPRMRASVQDRASLWCFWRVRHSSFLQFVCPMGFASPALNGPVHCASRPALIIGFLIVAIQSPTHLAWNSIYNWEKRAGPIEYPLSGPLWLFISCAPAAEPGSASYPLGIRTRRSVPSPLAFSCTRRRAQLGLGKKTMAIPPPRNRQEMSAFKQINRAFLVRPAF